MRISLRNKFAAVFASATLILLVAAIAYYALSKMRQSQDWVQHTQVVLDALAAAESHDKKAESAQSGYLVTGDRMYLDTLQTEGAAIANGIEALRHLTGDNPRQGPRIDRLERATQAHLGYLQDTTGIHDGLSPAFFGERYARSRDLANEVHAIVVELEDEERNLLASRSQEVEMRLTIAKVVLSVGSVLSFLLAVYAMRKLQTEVTEREHARHLIETQAKRLEDQAVVLAASKEAAEAASRTKTMFLANMSHELRTPLNAVIGYSEMLQEEAEERGVSSFVPDLQSIHSAGKHLLSLINDVLDLSKIEAGRMELFLEDFDVHAMLDEVASTIRPLVAQNKNTLEIHVGDIGSMRADLTKVRQTLFNILSNASKFTEAGTLRLEVERQQRDGESWAVFRIVDSGIGMTSDQLARLFEPFTQADASTTRKFGGTGLGLAISRRFCRMMGGDISVESSHGKGSTFTISLPLVVKQREAVEGRAASASLRVDAARPTVLVIDDDADTRDLLKRFLEKEGFTVTTASSGKEGIALARQLKPIAITLDVMMPSMDGWAVLTELKADVALREIPVIVVTMVTDRGLGYRLGASEFMTKPVDRARLKQVLARYRVRDTAQTVLVVEDDAPTRRMTKQMLEGDGWVVDEAENGRVALSRIADHRPDAVVLDLMMPEMDGFAFAAALSEHPELCTIPIIVLTAKEISEEERSRLSNYVEKIVQKGSYDRARLLGDVRDIVMKHAQQRAQSASAE